jgi:monoamine oxidase
MGHTPFLSRLERVAGLAHAARTRGVDIEALDEQRRAFLATDAKATGKAQLSAWHVNPDSFGAYSYWTPGYCEQFCTYERVPARPFHFAGEHVSQDFQGYIQGGADEGIRAANEIVADYK